MAKTKAKKVKEPRFTASITANAWFEIPLKAQSIEDAIIEVNERIKNEGADLFVKPDAYNDYNLRLCSITDTEALEGF